MKSNILKSLAVMLVILVALSANVSYAQTDTTKVHRIILTDGSELVGRVISESTAKVVFRTSSGVQMEIDRSSIKEMQSIDGQWIEGRFVRGDPNRTRLFFAPTARTLPQGKGYFSAYEIFFPMLAIGVNRFYYVGGWNLTYSRSKTTNHLLSSESAAYSFK